MCRILQSILKCILNIEHTFLTTVSTSRCHIRAFSLRCRNQCVLDGSRFFHNTINPLEESIMSSVCGGDFDGCPLQSSPY